jgi:hypothetical protein
MMCKIYRAKNKMAVSDIYNAISKAKQTPEPTAEEYAKIERILKITAFRTLKDGDKYYITLGDDSDGLVQVRIEGVKAMQAWIEKVATKIATFNLSHLVIQGRYREETKGASRFTEFYVYFRVAKGTTIYFETAKRHVPVTVSNKSRLAMIAPTKNIVPIYGEFETISAITTRELKNIITISENLNNQNTEKEMDDINATTDNVETPEVEDIAKTIAKDMQKRYAEPVKEEQDEVQPNETELEQQSLEKHHNPVQALIDNINAVELEFEKLRVENKKLKDTITTLQEYKQKFEAVQAMFK